ncbi:CBM35 domain-containing protein [Granulicella sp. dw_53]|uniref:alpha-galactosidase D n=1 Tax=Granulicella sp. dw_53 TaxID=2719792 RepID=UPI001BD1C37B|nr:CBM35 domain-containing protein [Granulicella sp. dw_53]
MTTIPSSFIASSRVCRKIRNYRSVYAGLLTVTAFLGSAISGHAQSPGVAEKPYLGWSSFSQQTISSSFLTQANIAAQSDAMSSSGLQAHGFNYINIDSGWMGSFDANGRPIPNTSTFPDIAALVAHIHQNGQKAGIYWIPGVEQPAVDANYPILGTQYHIKDILAVPYTAGNSFGGSGTSPFHYKIDFTKPGAQEYTNSVVNLFASWGIDFIKLDAVTPGSYRDDTSIDNRPDVAAWAKAIAQNGRPMWFTISWALDQDYLSTWQTYANARRIEGDVECEGNCSTLTNWTMTSQRFYDLVGWQNAAGPTVGWNDLDSLEVGNPNTDGLSPEEQQSAITLWAMANAPLYLGGDLTALDSVGKRLLSNDEVIAVDQSGAPAKQVAGGFSPVWAMHTADGSYYVALFNLNAFPSQVAIKWSPLGFTSAPRVRDVWNQIDLGRFDDGFSAVILGHGVRLLKVTPNGHAAPPNSQVYEAESGTLSGSASVVSCSACSSGSKVGNLGLGVNNTVTINNIRVDRAGTYAMEIDSMTIGSRALLYQVNGGPSTTLNVGGGSFNLPSSTTVPVQLKAGWNSIQFGNPTSYPPDLDRIVISGNGSAVAPNYTAYEAELATFSGSASASFCGSCSGVSEAGNIGGGANNNVTFTHVTVHAAGTYQMEIDYLTSGPRSFFMSVNGGTSTELDLDGSSFSLPTSTVIPVTLKAGSNTIQFGNPIGFAPALDRIAIAPTAGSATLSGSIAKKLGPPNLRIWKLSLGNSGSTRAERSQVNLFSLTQAEGDKTCHPRVIGRLPIEVGDISPGGQKNVEIPIDFSRCAENATFAASIVFSSNNGAAVDTITETTTTK